MRGLEEHVAAGEVAEARLRVLAHEAFGLGVDDFEKITINAMKSAFIPHNRRIQLIYDVIKPGYAKVRAPIKKRTR